MLLICISLNEIVKGCPVSIKDIRSRKGGVCPVRTFFGQGRGVLQMQMSKLFGVKNFEFFEILVCLNRQRMGWASTDILQTKGEGGQFFTILY